MAGVKPKHSGKFALALNNAIALQAAGHALARTSFSRGKWSYWVEHLSLLSMYCPSLSFLHLLGALDPPLLIMILELQNMLSGLVISC